MVQTTALNLLDEVKLQICNMMLRPQISALLKQHESSHAFRIEAILLEQPACVIRLEKNDEFANDLKLVKAGL